MDPLRKIATLLLLVALSFGHCVKSQAQRLANGETLPEVLESCAQPLAFDGAMYQYVLDLLQQLRSDDYFERERAEDELTEIARSYDLRDILSHLILNDPDAEVRSRARRILKIAYEAYYTCRLRYLESAFGPQCKSLTPESSAVAESTALEVLPYLVSEYLIPSLGQSTLNFTKWLSMILGKDCLQEKYRCGGPAEDAARAHIESRLRSTIQVLRNILTGYPSLVITDFVSPAGNPHVVIEIKGNASVTYAIGVTIDGPNCDAPGERVVRVVMSEKTAGAISGIFHRIVLELRAPSLSSLPNEQASKL